MLGWVAERFPALVRAIAARGHEMASHGYGHGLVYDQTPDAFREDIRRSKAVIESAGGAAVRGYRAPSYSITTRSLWALDVLIEEGFEYDASIFPIHHDRYGIPASPRHPVPHRTARRLAGRSARLDGRMGPVQRSGGRRRVFPDPPVRVDAVGHRAGSIGAIGSRRSSTCIPGRSIPDQPRLGAGALSAFRHYRNLGRTEERLRRLLADFRFDTLRTLVDSARPGLRSEALADAGMLAVSG